MKHFLSIPLILLMSFSLNAQTKKELKNQLKLQKQFVKEFPFVFIPSGSYTMGGTAESSPLKPGQIRVQSVSVDRFYMMQCEVSNLDYLSYVNAIKKEDSLQAISLLPDTNVWTKKSWHNNKYTNYYLRHPAYQSYPVVGVSYNQAVAYAKWMTDEYNNRQDEDKSFKKVRFRLPTEREWEYAARGGHEKSNFPWGGPYMRNAKGMRLANMSYISQASVYRDTVWIKNPSALSDSTLPSHIPKVSIVSSGIGDYMGVAGDLNDGADITAPVRSYWPNGYGLYNMTGNVEEMVDAWYQRDPQLYEFSHDSDKYKTQDPSGITRGGSWSDTGYYGMVSTRQFYEGRDSASAERGFRLVMDVLEY